ncbi:MAG: ABC transporter ATP-binding protein [Candidatus Dormibacteria bacterium]|jgi:ABC-type branched-subunit amino acid transport system ATPase component
MPTATPDVTQPDAMPGSSSAAHVTALELADVWKYFGAAPAVAGCTFSVTEAAIVGLIGPNGAGKSTVTDLVSGFKHPDKGRILFEGRDITGEPPYRVARAGLVRTFQIARVWPTLTVMENALVAAPDRGHEVIWREFLTPRKLRAAEAADRGRARGLLEEFGLIGLKNDTAETLSGGQKRLLEFVRIMMAAPRMVVLDEPMAGVNPVMAERIVAGVRILNAAGITVLMIEHNLEFVEEVCPNVMVMALGSVIAVGSMEELRRHPEVLDAYLGGLAGD